MKGETEAVCAEVMHRCAPVHARVGKLIPPLSAQVTGHKERALSNRDA